MAMVGSSNLNCLILQQIFHTTSRFPVEFHIVSLSSLVDEHIGVNTRAVHVSIILRNTHIIKKEGEHVQTLGLMGEEVNNSPVLLNVRLGIWLKGMYHVREFNSITNKEDREIVSHKIKVALSGVKLHSKASRIPQGFWAATLMDDSGEADDNRCLNSRGTKEIGTREVRDIVRDFKESFGTCSPSMNNTFWNPLPVEVGKLFHQMIILEKNWTSRSNGERRVVVPYGSTRISSPER
uniref:Catalase n=1 Tax=Rhizophora mucronata TaxID=61149 RepID=A0A2P2MJD2_RHIMU